MGRNLLAINIFVLSLLIASASAAEELIQNGGFESGELFPWEEVGGSDAWSVTGGYAYEGAYSALVRGPYQLAQSFEPRLGANIDVFSVAVMAGISAWITVEVSYDDEMPPTQASIYVPAALQWQTLDLLEYVDPDRDVYRVVLSGQGFGDSPDDMRTWYDAVTLQNNDPEDPVEEPEITETLQASTQSVNLEFDTKRLRTNLSLNLQAEGVPEGIHEGPVEIRVLFSQDGFTTAFETQAELEEVSHHKHHTIQLMDRPCCHKEKCKH